MISERGLQYRRNVICIEGDRENVIYITSPCKL